MYIIIVIKTQGTLEKKTGSVGWEKMTENEQREMDSTRDRLGQIQAGANRRTERWIAQGWDRYRLGLTNKKQRESSKGQAVVTHSRIQATLSGQTSDNSSTEEDVGCGTDNRVTTQATPDVRCACRAGNDVAAGQKYDSHRAIVAALACAHVTQPRIFLQKHVLSFSEDSTIICLRSVV